jgi:hypothetical protein
MAVLPAMEARVLLHPVVARVVALNILQRAPSPGHQEGKVLGGRPRHYMVDTAHRAPPWAQSLALGTHPRHASRLEVQPLRLLHLFTVLLVQLEYLQFRLATVPPRRLNTLQPVLIIPLPALSSLLPHLCTRQRVLSSVALGLPRRLQRAHLRRHPLILRRPRSGRLNLLNTVLHRQWLDHQPLPCRLLTLLVHQSSPQRKLSMNIPTQGTMLTA